MNLPDSSGWIEYFANGPTADSIIYATARSRGALVWTQDDDFEDLPEVRYFAKIKA
jgi:predicted nucleic acid-binding protein